MRKKDILELKKRFKKNDCTFTRLCGCYVNGEKNIVTKFEETFLTLGEDEFYKYLEIAKKVLSGTIGNNILQLNFPSEEENEGGKQHFLMELKKSKLKDKNILDDFYKLIIDSYDYEGNLLILLFHDAYDVITKTKDNSKLDESEEVFEYILCAICPVTLSKAGLGYIENDNKFAARVRDWVVETPSNGFVFPAFIERSTDIHSLMYYTKNAKDSHPELMENGLGCDSKQTATEQKETFQNIIINAVGGDDKKSTHYFMEIQDNLNTMIEEHNVIHEDSEEPIILTNDVISELLEESGLPEEITTKIEKSYTENFGDTPPIADTVIDSKALAAKAQKRKEESLERQVEILQNKLEITQQKVLAAENKLVAVDNNSDIDSNIDNNDSLEEQSDNNLDYDIIVKVKPEKIPQIKSQIIDGKKCIIIPVDENEQTNVNGIDQ